MTPEQQATLQRLREKHDERKRLERWERHDRIVRWLHVHRYRIAATGYVWVVVLALACGNPMLAAGISLGLLAASVLWLFLKAVE